MFKKKIILCFCFVAVSFLSACTTTDVEVVDYEFFSDLNGLKLQEGNDETIVYSRPSMEPFSAYSRFIVDPVRIDYTDPNQDELSIEDVTNMQNYLHDAMVSQLIEHGYTVGTRSEPGTLRIGFIVSGVKTPNALPNLVSAVTPIIKYTLSIGEVTVEGVFTDASSNAINVVAVSSTEGARYYNSTLWSTWADVESAFDQWAEGIVEFLDQESSP